jgi:hypothetical protein
MLMGQVVTHDQLMILFFGKNLAALVGDRCRGRDPI